MAETKEQGEKKPLTLSRPGRLELKKTVEQGQVRQSFSHGRTKAVTVEVKKKRTFQRGESGRMAEVKEAPDLPIDEALELEKEAGLSDAERAARQHALEVAAQKSDSEPDENAIAEAMAAAAEDITSAELDIGTPADGAPPSETTGAPTAGTTEAGKAEEAVDQTATARRQQDEMARQLAEKQVGTIKVKHSAKQPPKPTTPAPMDGGADAEAKQPARPNKRKTDAKRQTPSTRKGEPRRREGKLTIAQALEKGDEGERVRSLASVRRARERERQRLRELETTSERGKVTRDVVIPENITVQELANRMAEKGAEVVKVLMKLGVMATINQPIDGDTAQLVVEEFGHRIRRVAEADVEIGLDGTPDDAKDLIQRAPVVTIMGHVDHGKTSLLDALRETDVASREAGGITQHIGAYQVVLSDDSKITFVDTPGHEAFTEMRSRGANVTDLIVLVVAADDGIQPQTAEAIAHAKAAEVPMIVAINKMDAKGADADRVRQGLLQHEVVVEEMGGEVLDIEVSAKEKTNLDKLEEAILLQAELLELKANPDRNAGGVVVEAKLEAGRGPVATVLVQRGTLKVGDIFVAGGEWGRVRALQNDRGEPVPLAGPSEPVEVLGLNATPHAGDEFAVVENEARAREISEYRQRQARDKSAFQRGTVEQMFTKIAAGEVQELPLVVKSDVQGSGEAIAGVIEKLAHDEVAVRVMHAGVGGINESDVQLANTAQGIIIGFNVRANKQARELAQRDGVDIRYYSVIYDIANDLKAMLSGMLAPEQRETFLGYAEILEVFRVTKVGNVAGCRITEGQVRRGSKVRLLRDDVVIHEGTLSTLKRFKDEVTEVKAGLECGMSFENYNDIKVGDRIECFDVEEVAREL